MLDGIALWQQPSFACRLSPVQTSFEQGAAKKVTKSRQEHVGERVLLVRYRGTASRAEWGLGWADGGSRDLVWIVARSRKSGDGVTLEFGC